MRYVVNYRTNCGFVEYGVLKRYIYQLLEYTDDVDLNEKLEE